MRLKPRTLAGRIFFATAVISAALLAIVGIYAERRLRSFHEVEVRRRLETAANLFAASSADLLRGATTLDAFALELDRARQERLRLTIIRTSGEVLADSAAPPPLADHSGRPELLAAQQDGYGTATRRSATTTVDTFYLARRIERDGQPIGYVRVAAQLDSMQENLAVLHRALFYFGMAALVLGILAMAVVSRWLARPLQEIQRIAASIASGNLNERVRVQGPAEIRGLGAALNRLADQMRARIELMDRSRRETEAIHASMNEGVIAVDPHERVLLMNNAAARLLGLPRPLEAGAKLWEAVRFPELEKALRAALTRGTRWQGDAPCPGRDNRTLGISVTRVEPDIGAVALLADVTAIRRLDRVRIDFVANVSHEMRTPLTAVLGALETLGMSDQSAADHERFIDIARRNAIRMQAIVEDLLELSHIEVEGDSMPMEPLAIETPLRSAVRALSGTAETKGIALNLHLPEPSAPSVTGNAKRLEQVFTNLIDNAIKYTPEGGQVDVTLHVANDVIRVDVADTGIGMPAAALPRIFERFYRVDKSRSRDMGGTGLGLAIVKHCVRAHGAEILVVSREGEGTTFTVSIPRAGQQAG